MFKHLRFCGGRLQRWGGVALAFAAVTHAAATDWPRFRGTGLAATSSDSILTNWPAEGPPVAWQVENPGGYSTFAVAEGRVFTLCGGAEERCVARDAYTGAALWTTGLGQPALAYSTPTVQDGRVYVYSGAMTLFCLDAAGGGILWRRDLTNEFGGTQTEYGNSQSPWVEDGRVFVSIQAATNCLLAFNATNGTLLWRGHTNALTYGSPVGATLGGTRHIIFPDPYGLVAVAPEDGRLLWRLRRGYSPGRHGPSPLVCGDMVICVKTDVSGGEVFRVVQSGGVFSTQTLWTNVTMQGTYVTLVTHEGYLYGVFNNALQCYELATGRLQWRQSFPGFPSVILVNNHLLLLGQDGSLVLAKATPLAYEEVARGDLPGSDYENSAAFSNGRIYVRCPSRMMCLDASILAPLTLQARAVPGTNRLDLAIGCADGSPIAASRAPRIALRWTTNLSLSLTQWMASAPPTYSNGMLRLSLPITPLPPSRYFIAVEQQP